MVARRLTATLFVAGLALAACGDSDDSLASTPADSVEDAAPADAAEDIEPDTIEPASTDGPDASTDQVADEVAESSEPADESSDAADEQMFPDVIDATASLDGSAWTIAATLSSPYDTPERYADAWRVVGPDGTVYGERFLTHDHADEQPFTRSESGIEIPDDVSAVTIEGRDQQFGYGGETFELVLSR